jgi:hypothetical protein
VLLSRKIVVFGETWWRKNFPSWTDEPKQIGDGAKATGKAYKAASWDHGKPRRSQEHPAMGARKALEARSGVACVEPARHAYWAPRKGARGTVEQRP